MVSELEDRLERIREENDRLKKANTDLEQKTKKMATQLIRITADVSKKEKDEAKKEKENARAAGVPAPPASARGRKDIEAESLIDELRSQLRETKKQKDKLAIKLLSTQSAAGKQKPSWYARVQPKVMRAAMRSGGGFTDLDSVIGRINKDHAPTSRSVNDMPILEQQAGGAVNPPTDEKLNTLVGMLRQRVMEAESEIKKVRSENTVLRARPGQPDTADDAEYASLRQELREKGSKLNLLQSQYTQVEIAFKAVKENHEQVLQKYEELNKTLKEERRKNLQLEHDLEVAKLGEAAQAELKEIINTMREENKKLVDENMRLMTKQMSVPQLTEVRNKLRDYERTVQALQQQLSNQESISKKLKDTNVTLEARVQALTGETEALRKSSDEAQKALYKAQKECEALNRRIQIFSSDSGIDLVQLEKALALVGEQKISFDFEKEVDHDALQSRKEISSLRLANAELLQEIGKYKHLLELKEMINKEITGEKEHTANQVEIVRAEEKKEKEKLARELDAAKDRVKKLELEKRNIAYRTTKAQQRGRPATEPEPEVDPDLNEGENMVEITIEDATFSRRAFSDESISTFFTWDFYEHETQATGVIRGLSPVYNFAAQYVVKVDDFFIEFLMKQRIVLELHQANGLDFRLVGQCEIDLAGLLESGGMKHSMATVFSTSREVLGDVHFSMRLRYPITSSLRVYEESRKDPYAPPPPLSQLSKPKKPSLEETGKKLAASRTARDLEITIKGCTNLPLRADGSEPSPFVSFRFFGRETTSTPVAPNERNPSFKFTKSFRLEYPDSNLEEYLSNSDLVLDVFDDVNPNLQQQIGTAAVPLARLLEERGIAAELQLEDVHKSTPVSGKVVVQISWKTPLEGSGTRIQEQLMASEPSGSTVASSSATPPPSKSQKGFSTVGSPSATQKDFFGELTEGKRTADSMGRKEVVTRSHEQEIQRAMSGVDLRDTLIVGIGELSLTREVLTDPSLRALYVAYEFLESPVEDLETEPVRVEAARNGKFQFTHIQYFKVNAQKNPKQRAILKRVLADPDEEKSNILFTVVNEDEHGKCFEVGQCVLNIRDILEDKKDPINEPLPVYDSNNDDMNEIGSLRVSCIALAAIQNLK